LKNCNELKDELIGYYRKVLSEYNTQLDSNISENELRILYTYAEGVRVHINIQQDDCNQLNYRVQRRQYVWSMIIAYIALVITFGFSVLAFFDIKYPIKNSVSSQIECQFDSTKHLNDKSEQLNETITICCEDTVKR
jgi:hypothetical protein